MPLLQWGVVIGASLVAAVCDLHKGRVPNLLTGPVLLAGLAWALSIGGFVGLADACAGCLSMAAPYIFLFVFAAGGAGDAKLMGAIGAWLGVVNGAEALIAVLLSGAALGTVFALAKKRSRAVLANLSRVVTAAVCFAGSRDVTRMTGVLPKAEEMQTFPYGVAVFVGVCIAAIRVFAKSVP